MILIFIIDNQTKETTLKNANVISSKKKIEKNRYDYA